MMWGKMTSPYNQPVWGLDQMQVLKECDLESWIQWKTIGWVC